MWYYFLFGIFLCPTTVLTGTKLEPECLNLQMQFATESSEFTTCLGKNTKPVRICVTCFESYKKVNDSFFKIKQSGNCSDVLLDSDNAMVIRRLWDSYRNMWSSALCSTCSGLTENRTHEFRNRTDEVIQCFDEHKHKHTTDQICTDCSSRYDDLLNLFKSLQGLGYACADLADSMNSTAQSWSVKYNCGHFPVEYVPVLAMTASVSLLPVVFYLAIWKFIP